MKFFFTGAVKAGRENQKEFEFIIGELKKHGSVLSDHLGKDSLSHHGETQILSKDILQRELKKIHESDIIIAEVTTPSLGVGFFISTAIQQKKKVIALYKGKNTLKLSAIISGSPDIKVYLYQKKEDISFIIKTFTK